MKPQRPISKTKIAALVLASGLTLGAVSSAVAETVAIPLGQQGKAWNVESPRHGITKAQVEAQYGAPMTKNGPVGDPPIYKWEYDLFSVYFESDRVIHSVVKHQPKSN